MTLVAKHGNKAMTIPTPEQIQRQIALEMGLRPATEAEIQADWRGALPYRPWVDSKGNYQRLPNWSLDRNASKELPIEDMDAYWDAYGSFVDYYPHPERTAFDTAETESLAWLLYKGWHWSECLTCGGDGILHGSSCEKCKGVGSEFQKTDEPH